jgi:hypothetical protein
MMPDKRQEYNCRERQRATTAADHKVSENEADKCKRELGGSNRAVD